MIASGHRYDARLAGHAGGSDTVVITVWALRDYLGLKMGS